MIIKNEIVIKLIEYTKKNYILLVTFQPQYMLYSVKSFNKFADPLKFLIVLYKYEQTDIWTNEQIKLNICEQNGI